MEYRVISAGEGMGGNGVFVGRGMETNRMWIGRLLTTIPRGAFVV